MHCEPCSHSTASLNQGRSPKPCSGFPAIPDAAPVPSSSAATPATSARHIPDTGHSSQPPTPVGLQGADQFPIALSSKRPNTLCLAVDKERKQVVD